MFVYVKLRECGKLMIANDTEIRHFDSKHVNIQKFYKINHKNEFKDCSIVYCKESKEELQALIASRRASVPPLKRMQSASEISDADTPNKALLDIGDDSERILTKRLKAKSSQNELIKIIWFSVIILQLN